MDDGIDCIVTQMAYPPHRDVPQCSLPSNVWVMVAETGPWAEACPGEPEREMDEVRRWTEKLGHKIWMWTYPSKYGEKATPGVRIWRNIYTPAVLKQQVGHLMGFVLSRAVGEAWMDCMALEELGTAVGGK